MDAVATRESGNGDTGVEAPKLKRTFSVVIERDLFERGRFVCPTVIAGLAFATRAEKQATELLATPAPVTSPVHEGAIVAMKKESR
jgi:hypothetical protein